MVVVYGIVRVVPSLTRDEGDGGGTTEASSWVALPYSE